MSKGTNQKIKLLRLLELLRSDTDEENPMSTNTIIKRLKQQGIDCGRKALYADIQLLNDYGYEIMVVKERQNMYYVVDRTFDIAELRILLDAVQSATFITRKKTGELVEKISALAGSHKGDLLKQTTVYFDTLKHSNERIYYTVDAIDRAISEDKKISFCYFDLDINANKAYRRDKARYIVNPVGLVFSGGFYYLVCYSDTRKTLTIYRVDRMDEVATENDDIIYAKCIDGFNTFVEQNLAFGMYAGTEKSVTMLVHNSKTDVVFDKFGTSIRPRKADEEHFTVTVKAQISPVFLSWCTLFGEQLKIVSPQSVVDNLKEYLAEALNQYN